MEAPSFWTIVSLKWALKTQNSGRDAHFDHVYLQTLFFFAINLIMVHCWILELNFRLLESKFIKPDSLPIVLINKRVQAIFTTKDTDGCQIKVDVMHNLHVYFRFYIYVPWFLFDHFFISFAAINARWTNVWSVWIHIPTQSRNKSFRMVYLRSLVQSFRMANVSRKSPM